MKDDKPTCGRCGKELEQKFFLGGFDPIWRCRWCEYSRKPVKQ